MSASSPIRVAAQDALVQMLAARPEITSDVSVQSSFDGRTAKNQRIVFTNIVGIQSGIRAMYGRKPRRDIFELEVAMNVETADQTADSAKARVLVFVAALDDLLAQHAQLDDGQGHPLPGVTSAELSNYDGPNGYPYDKGWGAEIIAKVTIHSELV